MLLFAQEKIEKNTSWYKSTHCQTLKQKLRHRITTLCEGTLSETLTVDNMEHTPGAKTYQNTHAVAHARRIPMYLYSLYICLFLTHSFVSPLVLSAVICTVPCQTICLAASVSIRFLLYTFKITHLCLGRMFLGLFQISWFLVGYGAPKFRRLAIYFCGYLRYLFTCYRLYPFLLIQFIIVSSSGCSITKQNYYQMLAIELATRYGSVN